eukprot:TRINITY_DN10910_c0_g1_i1.p1 TRINITY_DN10910_c0_g1~~TRINITY_DN10910_c0_g1_i1.p1  ORF type:complete len:204 (+),score=35.05 TRINITY_DN10910_c0_g1_i1:347-958(+)
MSRERRSFPALIIDDICKGEKPTRRPFELSCAPDGSICYVSGSMVPIVNQLASESVESHDVSCCGGISGNTTTTTCGNGTPCNNICGSHNSGCITMICDDCHNSAADGMVCDTAMQEEQWCGSPSTVQGITNQCGDLKTRSSVQTARSAPAFTTPIYNINYCPWRCRHKTDLPRMKLCCLHPFVSQNVQGVKNACCVDYGLCV